MLNRGCYQFSAGREYEAEKVAKTEAAQRLGRDKQMENFLKDEGVALKLANNELRLLKQRKTELPQGIQNLLTDMRFDVDDLMKRHGFASEALKESGAAAATSATSRSEGFWYGDLVKQDNNIADPELKKRVAIFTLGWKASVNARNDRNALGCFCLDLERSASGNKE